MFKCKNFWMFLMIIVAMILVLFSIEAKAQPTPNWSTFNGGQLIVTIKQAEPMQLGNGWQSIAKGAIFSMPTSSFTQLWGYFGAQKGVLSLYTGPAFNWQGGDHIFAGVTVDIPFGRCLWETEVDNIFNTHQEQYLWSGLDFNFKAFGNHDAWLGLQVEATRTDKTCAQVGARIGIDRFQLGGYFGDRGWNPRFSFTIPIK